MPFDWANWACFEAPRMQRGRCASAPRITAYAPAGREAALNPRRSSISSHAYRNSMVGGGGDRTSHKIESLQRASSGRFCALPHAPLHLLEGEIARVTYFWTLALSFGYTRWQDQTFTSTIPLAACLSA